MELYVESLARVHSNSGNLCCALRITTDGTYCQYHIVLVPKYRFRILTGEVGQEVERSIRAFAKQQKAELVELSIQADHVHLLVFVPPKISISNFVGVLKGRTVIRILNRSRKLKRTE